MRIGCVIPSYNLGRFLDQAVVSAYNQTTPFDEILVVDDGSTDDTSEVAARLGVECLSIKNHGYAGARNLGARMLSKCDILTFLDADDWLYPTYVEKVVPYFYDALVGVVCPEVDADGVTVAGGTWAAPSDDDLDRLIAGNYVWAASAVRRQAFRDAGGFKPNFEPAADWALWVAIRAKGWRIKGIHEPLWHWRDRVDGMHMTIREDDIRARMREFLMKLTPVRSRT